MPLLPRITVHPTESLFEFFLAATNEQLAAEAALELLEDIAHDEKSILWAFRREGDAVSIFKSPYEHSVFIRDDYIVVPETRPYAILAWLPENISKRFVSESDKIPVQLNIPPCDSEPCTISLHEFLKNRV